MVEAAAEYAKTHGTASIDLSGYTDTVGTASYNVALSKRRADTVTRYLERLGIPQRAIKEAGMARSICASRRPMACASRKTAGSRS